MRARVKLSGQIGMSDMASFVRGFSHLNKGTLIHAVCALQDAIVHFARQGYSVNVEGLGVFTPKIKDKDNISLSFRLSKELKEKLGDTRDFGGRIINKRNAGKSSEQLIEAWNKAYPDNPVAV